MFYIRKMSTQSLLPTITKPGGIITIEDRIVASALPSTVCYTESSYLSLIDKPVIETITECYEGKIIRIFNVNGTWYVAGAARIVSLDKFYAGQTGQLFKQCVNAVFNGKQITELLNESVVYIFLLRPFWQLVCSVEPNICNRLILIATEYPIGKLNYDTTELSEVKRRQMHVIINSLDIVKYMKENVTTNVQGVIVNETVKILFDDYFRLKKLRGTCQTLEQRYLELRTTLLLDEFAAVFFVEKNAIEEKIYETAKRLHKMYLTHYVAKEPVSCLGIERQTLGVVHKKYLTSKQRTTPSRINDILAQLPATKLYRLINHNQVNLLN